MSNNGRRDGALRWLGRPKDLLKPAERRVLERAEQHRTISTDVNETVVAASDLGDRLADRIAAVGGSWSFILGFLGFLAAWVLLNAWLLGRDSFDPYPFIFLNLVLSMIAAIQAPIIMMSQNRAAERDRIDASHDYEVNLKAEIEIMALHAKLDALREAEIAAIAAALDGLAARLDRIERRPAALNLDG